MLREGDATIYSIVADHWNQTAPDRSGLKNKDMYVLGKKITSELEKHWAGGGGEKSTMHTQSRIQELLDSIEAVQEMD